MQQRYPTARLEPNALFVEDGTIFTSAGTAAGIDASLHLVRRELGTAIATKITVGWSVPPQRDGGQQQFVDLPIPVCDRQPDAGADLGRGAPRPAAHCLFTRAASHDE